VWSICQRYQLSPQDSDDVGQSVWLLLVENIAGIREAAALPGWLSTTTKREIFRVLRVTRRHDHDDLPPDGQIPGDADGTTIEEGLIVAELKAALRAAFAELQPKCYDLLSLLVTDPPLHYSDISNRLGIPVGSIGPKRARCLERLRRSPHLAQIISQDAKHAGVKETKG
jgi:RNA polymerase sigma factor (sigma-70 family)